MKVQISDHQHKSVTIEKALREQGVEIVRDHADILLIDVDFTVGKYPKIIEKAFHDGAEVVLYSHGAPVILVWDSVWEPCSYTRHYLAQSPGQKHVMEAYGYKIPISVIGWHFCKQKAFKPVKELKRVLFAPWHPHGNGWMNPEPMELNKQVYAKLLDMPYELTVRHIQQPENSGIELRTGVISQLSDAKLESAILAIDDADLIVTNPGTFACLAIARGKPVVMYGQDIQPHDGFSYEGLHYVRHWAAYREYLRYPYDLSSMKPNAAQNLIEYAAGQEATEWRSKFIGDPLDPMALMKALEGVLEDARS